MTAGRPSAAGQVVAAGGGRQIVVRSVEPADEAGLMSLYDGLDDDDRRRRFFALYRPRREFFTEMASVAERGGARLVAVLADPSTGDQRIVGEAGYVLLPDGDGELAIAVAKEWRGWLGPYLLDALVGAAAAAGVPNLEADVLTSNRAMLATLDRRGLAVMDRQDRSVIRLVIGTSCPVPTWPGAHDHHRVLVEGAGGSWLTGTGSDDGRRQVLVCPGPVNRGHGCPALVGEPCPLAAGADEIVVWYPTDDQRWRDLIDAHACVHPGTPVSVERGPRSEGTPAGVAT